tara:strand:+ start:892 stop:1044 length:153 start_codon:yes stop_codon:yes gene_type:complete
MEKFFYRGVNIFIPENLSDEEKDNFIRNAKSSVSRWRSHNRKPKRRRRNV